MEEGLKHRSIVRSLDVCVGRVLSVRQGGARSAVRRHSLGSTSQSVSGKLNTTSFSATYRELPGAPRRVPAGAFLFNLI